MRTPVIVRAIASGGKFIGDLVGGFTVTITIPGQNPVTIKSSGSSGNTANLMGQSRLRAEALPTNSDSVEMPGSPAASAQTILDIPKPVIATIAVTGPGKFAGQQATVTTTSWLLPEIGLTGSSKFTNGLVVELPGLLIQNPQAVVTSGNLSVSAHVTMMCGCKIVDNAGFWFSTDFVVTAQQLDSLGNVLSSTAMAYVPVTILLNPTPPPDLLSKFQVTCPAMKGVTSVQIIANQISLANTGCAVVKL